MEWVRGRQLGFGSFATVSLAARRDDSVLFPPLMAVKSSQLFRSQSLKHEREVLRQLDSCPEIIRCFGDGCTVEKGETLYNLILEYASRGSLADQLDKYGGRLPESLVRRYTRTILKGLDFVHSKEFVHCDIKLGNILIVDDGDAKIADFGLAKKAGEGTSTEKGQFELRGTPLSLSPESVTDNVYEPPCDIWALACAIVEMFTGKPAWNCSEKSNFWAVINQIGFGEELPTIPTDLSDEGKDFLDKCFVRDPTKRWSAQMLLNHPFVADDSIKQKKPAVSSPSPRSHFHMPECPSSELTAIPTLDRSHSLMENTTKSDGQQFETKLNLSVASPSERLRRLATADAPSNWSDSEGWISVRSWTVVMSFC